MNVRNTLKFVVATRIQARPGLLEDAAGPRQTGTPASSRIEPPPSALRFRAEALPFRYERGESGKARPSETTGGGVGMIDFDGDGDLDLFFAQGVPLPVGKSPDAPADVLLGNLAAGGSRTSRAGSGSPRRGTGRASRSPTTTATATPTSTSPATARIRSGGTTAAGSST